ncbi:MAG: HAMP domain-containing histidine kinase [Spirulina sp. SIO3F2]|nr:HAMP domain-containing histidine kinase [Spirulina sp. SIO3F2]
MLFHSLSQFGRAKLSRTLTLWVFSSFMLIEILVLIPSYWRRETELEAKLERLYPASVSMTLDSFGDRRSFQDWPDLSQLKHDPQLKGLALYSPQGKRLDTWGQVPNVESSVVMNWTNLQRQGNSYLVAWITPNEQTLLLVLDRAPVQRELYAYVGRILGLIALIGAVVTITTMVGIELLVIQPIVRLRRELLVFGQAIQGADIPKLQPTLTQIPPNELGDVTQTFAQLCDRIIAEMTERQQATSATRHARKQSAKLQEAITELQQQQLQLVHTEKMLSLEQLVAGMAHELNNPMAFIKGNINHAQDYIEGLLELIDCYQRHVAQPIPAVDDCAQEIELDFIRSDFPQVIGSINKGVQRLQTVVDSLRSFARLDEAAQKTIDIHDCLEQALFLLHHRLGSNQRRDAISVHKDYGQFSPIECYPSQLNQVFLTVLKNAIDSFDGLKQPQDCQITIQTRFLVIDKQVQILIADNGCGISSQVRDRIFDPFFTTKAVGSGTGLGLAIAYQIIHHNHGGELVFRSQVGIGTECWIDLPTQLGKVDQ